MTLHDNDPNGTIELEDHQHNLIHRYKVFVAPKNDLKKSFEAEFLCTHLNRKKPPLAQSQPDSVRGTTAIKAWENAIKFIRKTHAAENLKLCHFRDSR